MSGHECQKAEEAEGTETEHGPDFDRVPKDGDDEEAVGDDQARSIIQVFHGVTGQVIEEGLNEDQSDSAISRTYTECVAL